MFCSLSKTTTEIAVHFEKSPAKIKSDAQKCLNLLICPVCSPHSKFVLAIDLFLPWNRIFSDRIFSRFFSMRIGEKINIVLKRAHCKLSVESYITILATPSPLCYMPTSWGRPYFLKIALIWVKNRF